MFRVSIDKKLSSRLTDFEVIKVKSGDVKFNVNQQEIEHLMVVP